MHTGKRGERGKKTQDPALNQRRLQEAEKKNQRETQSRRRRQAKPADTYEEPGRQPAEMNSQKHERKMKRAVDISAFTCQDSDPDLVVVVR